MRLSISYTSRICLSSPRPSWGSDGKHNLYFHLTFWWTMMDTLGICSQAIRSFKWAMLTTSKSSRALFYLVASSFFLGIEARKHWSRSLKIHVSWMNVKLGDQRFFTQSSVLSKVFLNHFLPRLILEGRNAVHIIVGHYTFQASTGVTVHII